MLWRWVCRMVLRLAVKCRYEVILRAMELANVVYDCYEQDERDEPARDNDEDEATALLLQQILPFAGVDLDDTVASSQHTTDHSADWAQSEGSIPSPQKRTSPPPQPLDWDHDAITSYSSMMDVDYICRANGCNWHWGCRRIHALAPRRGWELRYAVVDGVVTSDIEVEPSMGKIHNGEPWERWP